MIPLYSVESSQIEAVGHDPETNTLAVRFKSWKKDQPGSLYHYQNFTAEDYEAFRNAESIGSHFGKMIKPEVEKYPFTRINETEEGKE